MSRRDLFNNVVGVLFVVSLSVLSMNLYNDAAVDPMTAIAPVGPTPVLLAQMGGPGGMMGPGAGRGPGAMVGPGAGRGPGAMMGSGAGPGPGAMMAPRGGPGPGAGMRPGAGPGPGAMAGPGGGPGRGR